VSGSSLTLSFEEVAAARLVTFLLVYRLNRGKLTKQRTSGELQGRSAMFRSCAKLITETGDGQTYCLRPPGKSVLSILTPNPQRLQPADGGDVWHCGLGPEGRAGGDSQNQGVRGQRIVRWQKHFAIWEGKPGTDGLIVLDPPGKSDTRPGLYHLSIRRSTKSRDRCHLQRL
jgi:hypothetical protein